MTKRNDTTKYIFDKEPEDKPDVAPEYNERDKDILREDKRA